MISIEISDIEKNLSLFKDDIPYDLLHEINIAAQHIKDWEFKSRLINPKQITPNDIGNPVSIISHYNKFNEIYIKLSKLDGSNEN